MNENRILVLVTYTSIASLLTLILMIVYGNINFDDTKFNEWIAPSTIATLIGGLGGAFAGTWLSGRNANKLWEEQEKKRLENEQKKIINNKKVFNSIVYAELKNIEINALNMISKITFSDYLFDDVYVNTGELMELFNDNIDDVGYSVKLIESAYNEIKAFAYNDSIDYDIFGKISNVRIRTVDYYNLVKEHGYQIEYHLQLMEYHEPEKHEALILQTIVGMNLVRLTIIDLYNFFKELDEKNVK